MTDRYGVWGGRLPGGWCHIYLPECGDDQCPRYIDTRERATAAARRFRVEYPGVQYDAVPYDSDREPASVAGRPSHAQRRALELLTKLVPTRYSANYWHTQVVQATVDALHARGWIFYRPTDDGRDSRLVVTASGQEALGIPE